MEWLQKPTKWKEMWWDVHLKNKVKSSSLLILKQSDRVREYYSCRYFNLHISLELYSTSTYINGSAHFSLSKSNIRHSIYWMITYTILGLRRMLHGKVKKINDDFFLAWSLHNSCLSILYTPLLLLSHRKISYSDGLGVGMGDPNGGPISLLKMRDFEAGSLNKNYTISVLLFWNT